MEIALLARFKKRATKGLTMPKYSTEIRKSPREEYIKVFLANNNELTSVKERLELIRSVRRVNISNENRDLTVYVKQPFSAKEAIEHIKKSLDAYYSGTGCRDSELLKEVLEIRNSLSLDSKARKCYNDALSKMVEAKYDRNCLDDIRLALELFLKEILKNDKPLEKQSAALKAYFEQKKMSSELIKVNTQSLFNLCEFFNNHTKHDYNVRHHEVDTVIGYANQIMKSILADN